MGHHPTASAPFATPRECAREKRITKQNQSPPGHKTTHRHTNLSGGACLALPLVVTATKREVHHIYVTGWYYLGALIWFPVLFLVANIPGLHVGAQQATVNWWFAHNVLGLWLTPLGVGAAYYFIPRIIGKPIYSYRLSLVGFWALALFYSQVGIHHLIGGPVPTWVVTLSVVQSVMMFVPRC